jgi:hypothetical protein
MSAAWCLNREGMTFQLKASKTSKKGYSRKRRKVKSKAEDKATS